MTAGTGAVVIGIGNAVAGDDAAGLVVARRVRERAPAGLRVIEVEGEPTRAIDEWEGAEAAILVDAVRTSAATGTVIRVDARATPLPAELRRASTHAMGIGDAIELARSLDRLPPRLVVYGIAGERFEAGAEMTPAVASAIDEVAQRLLAEVR